MKTKLLAIMLLAGSSMFAETRVAIGLASEETVAGSTSRLLLTAIGRKTTAVTDGSPDTGTGSHSTAVTKSRRTMKTNFATDPATSIMATPTTQTTRETVTKRDSETAGKTPIKPAAA